MASLPPAITVFCIMDMDIIFMLSLEVGMCKDGCSTKAGTVVDEEGEVIQDITCKLEAFESALDSIPGNAKVAQRFTIDGLSIDGKNECRETTAESKIKVLDHDVEKAYLVEVDTIIRQPVEAVIRALGTGGERPLQGVTRIVGYYSRIDNWNKSKISELQARHKGRYGVGGCR